MSPRPLPGPRLGRLLALVPWVLAHPGVTIAELAQRFEVDEEDGVRAMLDQGAKQHGVVRDVAEDGGA